MLHGGFCHGDLANPGLAESDLWVLLDGGWCEVETGDSPRPSARGGHSLTFLPAFSSDKQSAFLLLFGAVNDVSYAFPTDRVWMLFISNSTGSLKITWTPAELDTRERRVDRYYHSATLLPSGDVLVVGGRDDRNGPRRDACILRRVSSPLAADGSVGLPRWQLSRSALLPPSWQPCFTYHSAVLLFNKVYVFGKLMRDTKIAVYDCVTRSWSMQSASPPDLPSRSGSKIAAHIDTHRAVRIGSHILLVSFETFTSWSKYVLFLWFLM